MKPLPAARSVVATGRPLAVRRRILAFIDAHPDALERTCGRGHLTGSALVVDAGGARALLMHHRKLDRWLQMGGHADGDGDLRAVARREAVEESGIGELLLLDAPPDLDVHRVEPPGEAPHLHLDVRFVAVAPPDAEPVANRESIELRWFPLAEVARWPEAGLRRLARLAAASHRPPPPPSIGP